MRITIFIVTVFLFCYSAGTAQVGGNSTLSSLQLSSSPIATAMGGRAFSLSDENLSIALENPALIDSTVHKKLAFNNAFYIANSYFGSFIYGHHFKRAGSFVGALKYVTFGKFDGRDLAGNPTNTFRAGDYALSFGYGNSVKSFRYGANAKFIFSHLEQYQSTAVAFDVGLAYHNKEKNLIVTVLADNLGMQLSTYTIGEREKLPMNVSIGFSKKFEQLPFRINIVAHNLQSPKLSYEFEDENDDVFGFDNSNEIPVLDMIFRHFNFGGEIFIAKVVIVRFGYNHLRRKDVGLSTKKGFAGLSVGTGIHIKQFKIDYGFAKYHQAANNNHLGITVNLNEFTTIK